jgi:hypothetical protein
MMCRWVCLSLFWIVRVCHRGRVWFSVIRGTHLFFPFFCSNRFRLIC